MDINSVWYVNAREHLNMKSSALKDKNNPPVNTYIYKRFPVIISQNDDLDSFIEKVCDNWAYREEDFKKEGGNSATYRRVDLVDIVFNFYWRNITKWTLKKIKRHVIEHYDEMEENKFSRESLRVAGGVKIESPKWFQQSSITDTPSTYENCAYNGIIVSQLKSHNEGAHHFIQNEFQDKSKEFNWGSFPVEGPASKKELGHLDKNIHNFHLLIFAYDGLNSHTSNKELQRQKITLYISKFMKAATDKKLGPILIATPKKDKTHDVALKDADMNKHMSDKYFIYAHCDAIKDIHKLYRHSKRHSSFVCINCGDCKATQQALYNHFRNGCYELHPEKEEDSQETIIFKAYNLLGEPIAFLVIDFEAYSPKYNLGPSIHHQTPYFAEVLLYTKYTNFIPHSLVTKFTSTWSYARFDGADCPFQVERFMWKLNKYFVNKLTSHNKKDLCPLYWADEDEANYQNAT